ncbi:eCIS core domain-containing protein [Mycobacterium sp. UM_WGJ]|uniref:eCIS core domain-containing protein n=1 Tax=unclassified Mycobacterium TaxID=2642494 RepID=UPI000408E9B0
MIVGVALLRVAARPPATEQLVVGDDRSVVLENLGGQRGEELLSRVAANIGAAVDAVEAFWGTDWSHRIQVTATGSDRQFVELAGHDSADVAQWSDVAAVAVADRVDPERRTAVGQRIVFAPGADAMSTPALRIVLTHELFHYAARTDTAFDAPRWLTEGVADFVARPTGDRAIGVAGPVLALPSDADLDAPGPRRANAYDRAWEFARFVAERFGTAKLRELYLTACGPGHVPPPVAVQLVLGVDLPELLAGWQQWRG